MGLTHQGTYSTIQKLVKHQNWGTSLEVILHENKIQSSKTTVNPLSHQHFICSCVPRWNMWAQKPRSGSTRGLIYITPSNPLADLYSFICNSGLCKFRILGSQKGNVSASKDNRVPTELQVVLAIWGQQVKKAGIALSGIIDHNDQGGQGAGAVFYTIRMERICLTPQ